MLRFSTLKMFALSAQHYRSFIDEPREDSTAMRIGRGTHALILGGAGVAVYEGRRYGKNWEEYQAEHPGEEILNTTEFATCASMVTAVLADDFAREILARAPQREVEVTSTIDGHPVGGRIDAYGDSVILDLKTTRCAKPEKFAWDARDSHYPAQLSWYRTLLGSRPRESYIIAAENVRPYCVVVYHVTESELRRGEEEWRSWLARYDECVASGSWPGYVEGIQELGEVELTIGGETVQA